MDYTMLSLYKLRGYRDELEASIRWWQEYTDYALTHTGVQAAQARIVRLEGLAGRVSREIATRKAKGEWVEVVHR